MRITGSDFRSMIFPTQYHVPSYGHWLLHEADMSSAYRWHRLFLQHLQSRHPTTQWVLKSPGHIWCLGALLDEYPDALLVQTHRDPLRIIASISSLIAHLRKLACDDPTIPEAAEEFAEYIVDGLNWSIDVRESGTVRPEQIVDLQFAEFMADPFGTIGAIYDRLGLELTPATEQRMRDHLAANPKGAHGVHTYTWDATGLDEGELARPHPSLPGVLRRADRAAGLGRRQLRRRGRSPGIGDPYCFQPRTRLAAARREPNGTARRPGVGPHRVARHLGDRALARRRLGLGVGFTARGAHHDHLVVAPHHGRLVGRPCER